MRSGAGDEMIAVFGARTAELRASIDEKGINSVMNPDYAIRHGSTLKAGTESSLNNTEAVLFAMGDQPLISPVVIKKLADEFSANEKGSLSRPIRDSGDNRLFFLLNTERSCLL